MNKEALIAIVSAVVVTLGMFFFLEVKVVNSPKEKKTTPTESLDTYIQSVFSELPDSSKLKIQPLMPNGLKQMTAVQFKELSGLWYKSGFDLAAAYFAKKAADLEPTEETLSLAGANFFTAAKKLEVSALRDQSFTEAEACFKKAFDLNPSKWENKMNLALCYTENPLPTDPMKGILMLRELDAAYPSNVAINLQLARLAIKTGQYERCIDRLEKILPQNSNDVRIICLLSQAYSATNNPKAAEFEKRCGQ